MKEVNNMARNMYEKRKERKEERENSTNNAEGFQKTVINWYPGHMAKAKRLMKEKIELIDIVIEFIDTRIPYSSKIKDIDEIIKNKKRILVMTKIDLCDLIETGRW